VKKVSQSLIKMAVITPGDITQSWFGQQVKIYDTSISQLMTLATAKPGALV
jgi:hypothetical protein